MIKREIHPNVFVSAVGQGTGVPEDQLISDSTFVTSLKTGIDLGMTFIDTAEVYGAGRAEELVGKATLGIRDKVFIATKVSPEHCEPITMKSSVIKSLIRLKTDYIDLYQIHWLNLNIPMEDMLQTMTRLVDAGLVRFIGVCNFSASEVTKALSILTNGSLVSVQQEYNLLERTVEGTHFSICIEKGIFLIAYSSLLSGKSINTLAKKKLLEDLSSKYGVTVYQIMLNWLLRPHYVIAIPRSFNAIHLKENATACNFKMDDGDYDIIANAFMPKIELIPVSTIRVVQVEGVKGYSTLQEAIDNRFAITPGPLDLAAQMTVGEFLKPIKVKRDPDSQNGYILTDGKTRYWAWVIAFKGERPIPALVEEY